MGTAAVSPSGRGGDRRGCAAGLAGRLSAAVLDKFRSTLLATLGDASVLKGAKIFFSCRGDSLTISTGTLSGNAQSIRDKTLCPAFIDVYLGPKPISPAA